MTWLDAYLLTAALIASKFRAPVADGRYASVDGLRGFLAFFVFLHHSCIWYFYLQTGNWGLPSSNLYVHFGQSSVALFFMITGFLFFNKLLEGRSRDIDWLKLFISRILRLTPLYSVVVALLFLVVLLLSKGQLNEPVSVLVRNAIRWMGFTLTGNPDLNGVERTWLIVAGVMWSLPFEWKFYFSLPLFALLLGQRPPFGFIALSLAAFAYLQMWLPSIHYLSFVGGIAAAFLVRSSRFCHFASGTSASVLAVGSLLTTVLYFPGAYEPVPLFLLSIFFALVAAGNSLFGLLLWPSARTLGEFAYGIYLIHGIVLFVTFTFIIGLPRARGLSVEAYWALILGLTPLVVSICFLAFRYIERPAMHATVSVTQGLRRFWSKLAMRFIAIGR